MPARPQWQATREDILDMARTLAAVEGVQKVILFGSHARGEGGRDSDVDLLVVTEYAGRPARYEAELLGLLPRRLIIDLHVRRPGELERRAELGDPFAKAVLREGEMLYERDSAGVAEHRGS
ncbi:MAG: nucleotidyltransferase domain-containing protein [Armatimonadia bacterium]|nr:nucleotidyltransferase domain-containing protein [Armatimonadia bacterium]